MISRFLAADWSSRLRQAGAHDEMDARGPLVPSMAPARTLRRGQHLYRPGDTPGCVYAIYAGTLKTYRIAHDCREQVSGFHFPGEMLGLEALLGHPVRGGAVALDTVVVYRMPAAALLRLADQSSLVQLLEHFSHEITRLEEHLSLDTLSAEQRLAAFILWVVEKLSGGFTESVVRLPMSHKEIGNYLRLVPETVSRLLARFQERDWLFVSARELTVRNRDMLLDVAAGNSKSRTPRSRMSPASTDSR